MEDVAFVSSESCPASFGNGGEIGRAGPGPGPVTSMADVRVDLSTVPSPTAASRRSPEPFFCFVTFCRVLRVGGSKASYSRLGGLTVLPDLLETVSLTNLSSSSPISSTSPSASPSSSRARMGLGLGVAKDCVADVDVPKWVRCVDGCGKEGSITKSS